MIAASVKPCIVNVLHTPFQNTPEPGALDLYFTFLFILPDAGAISTSAEFLYYFVICTICTRDTFHLRQSERYLGVQNNKTCVCHGNKYRNLELMMLLNNHIQFQSMFASCFDVFPLYICEEQISQYSKSDFYQDTIRNKKITTF